MPLTSTIEEYCQKSKTQTATPWLKDYFQSGLTRFLSAGIPTVTDEEWKYTNLSALSAIDFKPVTQIELSPNNQIKKICTPGEASFVFVNGVFDEKLSSANSLPNGLAFLPLKDAYTKKEAQIKSLLTKYESKDENSFIALSRALGANGLYIEISNNANIEKLIHIVHITTCKDPGLAAPRSIVIVGKSAEATILETHIGTGDDVYLSCALCDIYLDENAVLHYCKAQSESLKAYHIGNTRVWQERNSHFDGFSLMNGSSITRNNLDIISNGEGTSSTLNGFYGVNGNQHVDNHSSMDHRLPNCTSNQLYKGLLNGDSHSVFNGKIFVRQAAQKTNSYQLNKNLILGVNCRVDTKPQLEIFADDVKCTHGATIGQLNEDEIFYLQTRCIPKKNAVKLLAHGFVQDILNKIHHPAVIEKLSVLLEPTFANLE